MYSHGRLNEIAFFPCNEHGIWTGQWQLMIKDHGSQNSTPFKTHPH
jgi:hypothetical protein